MTFVGLSRFVKMIGTLCAYLAIDGVDSVARVYVRISCHRSTHHGSSDRLLFVLSVHYFELIFVRMSKNLCPYYVLKSFLDSDVIMQPSFDGTTFCWRHMTQ